MARRGWFSGVFIGLLSWIGLLGVANAQPPTSAAPATRAEPSGSYVRSEPSAAAVQAAHSVLNELTLVRTFVQHQLQRVRGKDDDPRKLTLRDQLVRLRRAINVAQQRTIALRQRRHRAMSPSYTIVSLKPTRSTDNAVKRGDYLLGQMAAKRRAIQEQRLAARKRRDVVVMHCLDLLLGEVDGALRAAHTRRQALEQAAATGDSQVTSYDLTILATLRDRVVRNHHRASRCVNVSALGLDAPRTRVSTHVAPLPSLAQLGLAD